MGVCARGGDKLQVLRALPPSGPTAGGHPALCSPTPWDSEKKSLSILMQLSALGRKGHAEISGELFFIRCYAYRIHAMPHQPA